MHISLLISKINNIFCIIRYAVGIFVDTNEPEYAPLMLLSKSYQKNVKAFDSISYEDTVSGLRTNKPSVYLARKRCNEVEIG